jgi:uncharacterized protein
MKVLKPSYFNFVVHASPEDYLVYNTKNTGLIHLNARDGELMERLNAMDKIVPDAYPENQSTILDLYDKGFFIDYDLDEREMLHAVYNLGKDVHSKDTADINLTIGTTILCNMGCSYCFEFVKPNKTLKDEAVIDGILNYLEDMMAKAQVKKWRDLNVVWYGGEPLINKTAIEKLSPRLMALCEERGMNYRAEIITNGLLLDEKAWTILKKLKVKNVQVTIDGPKEIHDVNRPLLGSKSLGNYDRIMKHLALMPEGMNLTIRVNLDKRVYEKFEVLLMDLKHHGIWPQRYKNVHINISWLRTYEEELNKKDVTGRLKVEEFYYALKDLKLMKRNVFNDWATENGLGNAKIKWELPELQAECATWVSPYSMVIDPEGNIHKCWETIHDKKESVSHVSQGYKMDDYDKYSQYDRYRTTHEKCKDCKFIPICDQLSCSHQVVGEQEPPCTYWKYVLTDSLKDQFLFMKANPEKMAISNEKSVNTGHSNK